jgi:hypothetical protein
MRIISLTGKFQRLDLSTVEGHLKCNTDQNFPLALLRDRPLEIQTVEVEFPNRDYGVIVSPQLINFGEVSVVLTGTDANNNYIPQRALTCLAKAFYPRAIGLHSYEEHTLPRHSERLVTMIAFGISRGQ